MKIHWHNIVALLLTVFAIVILVTSGTAVGVFLRAMTQIGPGYSKDEQVMGLIAFGLVLVGIVAVVKILFESNRKN